MCSKRALENAGYPHVIWCAWRVLRGLFAQAVLHPRFQIGRSSGHSPRRPAQMCRSLQVFLLQVVVDLVAGRPAYAEHRRLHIGKKSVPSCSVRCPIGDARFCSVRCSPFWCGPDLSPESDYCRKMLQTSGLGSKYCQWQYDVRLHLRTGF
jgi:hypothetical protein